MYSRFRIFFFSATLLFFSQLNSCIVLTKTDFSDLPIRFAENVSFPYKKLSLRVMYIPEKNDIIFNLNEEEQQEREEEWKKNLISSYRDSGLFEDIVSEEEEEEEGDLQIRIKVVELDAEDRDFSYLISKGYGFVPYREEGSFMMSSDFYDSSGNHLGSIDLHEKYEFYYQVLFVFLMPFYYPSGEYEDLIKHMSLKTLQNAISKGFVKVSG